MSKGTIRKARHLKAKRRVLHGQGAQKKKPQHRRTSARHMRSLQ